MDLNDKLKQFTQLVLDEAEKNCQTHTDASEKKYEEAVCEFDKKAKLKYERRYNEETLAAKRKKQKTIVEAEAKAKKEPILKRNMYMDNLFANVIKKLDDFFLTEEYEKQLMETIDQYKNADEKQNVYLVERDMRLKDKIESTKAVTVIKSNDDFIGGLKITIGSMRIADCSYKTKFEEERSKFNKIRVN